MNCIIIDDEATARVIIGQLCSKVKGLNILEEFSNAIQAIKYLNQNEIDLIFLDIHMPDFTGFDFIETLKNPPKIILTTSDSNFAIQAFEYNCIIDYLVKPITPERFRKAVQKATDKLNTSVKLSDSSENLETTSVNDLYINIDRRLIKIDISSIYLIEAKGDYINVKTEDKNYTVHSTLKKIEDNSVLIKRDVIPVSRSNRPELMKRLNLL